MTETTWMKEMPISLTVAATATATITATATVTIGRRVKGLVGRRVVFVD
jgi:hypothetical protein